MTDKYENTNLVLIVGKSTSGKSASLRNLKNPEGVIYLQCETNKRLPFADKFKKQVVTDPRQVPAIIQQAEDHDKIHTVVVDTITFLMDMYESKFCVNSKDGRKAWGDYAQYWKKLMQQTVASSSKNIIMLAHTMDVFNEGESIMENRVKVKGSLMNQGIEAYFCNVIACKKMPIKSLENYSSALLTYTPEEEALGYKYVYQTKLTKETIHESIRGPLNLWNTSETYIDNDAQLVLDRLHEYYDNDE
jgi:hypothetical protein